MKTINFCHQCGNPVNTLAHNLNEITCPFCFTVLNVFTGEIISKPVIAFDIDPGDYPEGFNSELYGL